MVLNTHCIALHPLIISYNSKNSNDFNHNIGMLTTQHDVNNQTSHVANIHHGVNMPLLLF